MIRLFAVCAFLATLTCSSCAYAGDKEELDLKAAWLQERVARLSAEYSIAAAQLQSILSQRAALLSNGSVVSPQQHSGRDFVTQPEPITDGK